MKNILVPCDFSKPSREAFKVAVEIATKSHGEVTLLYVIYLPAMYDGIYVEGATYSPSLIAQMQDDAERTLKAIVDTLPAGSPNVTLKTEIGDVLQVIKETVKEKGIDLVVMGTTGSSGILHFLVGSTTEKIVRHMPVPVLAVETADFIKSVKHILVPSALGFDQTHFIDKVKALQDFFGATLHILHVNTPKHFKRDRDAYRAMDEFVRHYRINNYEMHFVNDYSEEAGITAFAVSQKMDLIAMGTHARKGLSHLINTNVTESVVDHLHSAVWTCALKS